MRQSLRECWGKKEKETLHHLVFYVTLFRRMQEIDSSSKWTQSTSSERAAIKRRAAIKKVAPTFKVNKAKLYVWCAQRGVKKDFWRIDRLGEFFGNASDGD